MDKNTNSLIVASAPNRELLAEDRERRLRMGELVTLKAQEQNIKNLITIKTHNFDFFRLRQIIDYSILIDRKNINIQSVKKRVRKKMEISEVKAYFISECINNNLCNFPKIIKPKYYSSKKQKLLDIYYRVTNNNFILLYTVINNFNKIKKFIDSDENPPNNNPSDENPPNNNPPDDNPSDNNPPDDNPSDDNPPDDNPSDDNPKNNNEFIDIFQYKNIKKKILQEEIISVKNNGCMSLIKFYNLNPKIKNLIEEIINFKISDSIVEKEFIHIKDKTTNKLGGLNGQKEREINSLKKLYKKTHFPLLLAVDNEDNKIYMNDCGGPLDKNNIPENWKIQITEIVQTLKECSVSNNDMWFDNFLVKDNIIYLIDFGWGTDQESFPYVNITINDIEQNDNLIFLLDNVFERSIEKRIEFRQQNTT